jgi:hypothetical protein
MFYRIACSCFFGPRGEHGQEAFQKIVKMSQQIYFEIVSSTVAFCSKHLRINCCRVNGTGFWPFAEETRCRRKITILGLASWFGLVYIVETVELRIHVYTPPPSSHQAGAVCYRQIFFLSSFSFFCGATAHYRAKASLLGFEIYLDTHCRDRQINLLKSTSVFFIIWFVRLLALRPLLAYCASLGW